MYVFILLLYIWCNTDVADTHLIPTRRHTEIGTMVILGIQRLSNYFFPSPLIKQSLFDLKLGKIASLFKNRCWFPLWLFFFPPSVQVRYYKTEDAILPSLGW